MKFPKITIDPSALKHGVWGNTWKQWGWILLAFLALYGVLTGYLTGMLFAAQGIRYDNYRTMSGKYFGDFDRALFVAPIPTMPTRQEGRVKDPNYFNRPDSCVEQEVAEALPGFPNEQISRPNGILACSNSDKQWRWTVYPWVSDTDGLGAFPGCSNAQGSKTSSASYLSQATSYAAAGAGNATEADIAAWVCQNNVPVSAAL